MSALALPYTVLILLVELAAGALAIVTVFDGRAMVTRGYVQTAALVVLPLAVLALLLYGVLGAEDVVDGFALHRAWMPLLHGALVALLVLTVGYGVAAFRAPRALTVALGGLGTIAGAVAVAALAAVVSGPTWSYAGTVGGMLAAAGVLGGTLMAMIWGHWYLTNSGLPKEPMVQMSLLVIGALALQALFVLAGAFAPVREQPLSDAAFGVALGRNPAFWLRIGVGLLFPALLATLAWRAAAVRGMMSATGLLYIAVGGVLTGEVLARGLMFATGAAV